MFASSDGGECWVKLPRGFSEIRGALAWVPNYGRQAVGVTVPPNVCESLVKSRDRILLLNRVTRLQSLSDSKSTLSWYAGTSAALAAKKATNTIPIVMTSSARSRRQRTYRRTGPARRQRHGADEPERRVRRKTFGGAEGNRSSALARDDPGAGRQSNRKLFHQKELPARALKVQLIRFPVRGPEDYEGDISSRSQRTGERSLFAPSSSSHSFHAAQTAGGFSAKNHLPAMYESGAFVEDGGLIGYGVDRNWRYQRAAVYVEKIFKGAKPADLPVEQPTKFELFINLKAAKQIGLTIPSKRAGASG